MFNKKRILVFVVFVLLMFLFITFAGGTPQNHAIATRLVTFIDGYDNSQISQQKVIVGEDAVVPEDPKHDYLVFAGWYLEEDREIEVKDFTNIQKDITVVAEYAKDLNRNGIDDEVDEYFTVTFVDTYNNTTIKTQRVLTGMNATAPKAPSHNGLIFVGWSRAYTNVRKSITVYTVYRNAVVEANMYNVTFIDGDTLEEISTVQVEEGLSATAPVPPVHENRVFDYWDGNYTNVLQNETVTAIYADDLNGNEIPDYKEEKYSVTYENGLEEVTGEAPVDENEYLEGLTYIVKDKNTLELEKGVFIGWTKENPEKIIETTEEEDALVIVIPEAEITMQDSDVTYYAVWAIDENENNIADYKEEKYNVSYEKGIETVEGNAPIDENEYLEGLKYTVKENEEMSNEKTVFIGWATNNPEKVITTLEEENSLTLVKENEEVVMENSDVVYYAVWASDENGNNVPDYKDTKYTVEFTSNNKELLSGTTKFENILTGLNFYDEVEVPTINENKEDNLAFDKWNPVLPEESAKVESDLTFEAIFAEDKNNNEIPDYKEDKYTVNFVAGENGSLEGTTKYENLLIDLTFAESSVVIPTPVANEGYTFDKWNETTPENTTVITGDLTYTAIFAEDLNNNEIPDYKENHFTVEFTSQYKELLNGTTKFENILTGLNFYDEVEVPTIIENNQDNLAFDKWNPVLPEENAKVESNLTFEAVFAEDLNNNEIPDYKEDKYTVNFVAGENGSLNGTVKFENLLINLTLEENNVVIPTPVANEGYAFDKWTETTPENTTVVTGNLTYTATFAIDKNNNDIPDYKEDHFTVEFTSEHEELLNGTTKFENILTGLKFYDEVEVPTIIENKEDNLAFDKWNPVLPEESAKVESNLTFEAVFAEDRNNNETPDYKEDKYTVEFIAGENGSLNGTTKYENLLIDLTFAENNVVIPTPVANEGYAFDKWTETTPENTTVVTGNLTYTAVFAEDKNNNNIPDYKEDKYTVNFVAGENGSLEGTTKFENLLIDLTFAENNVVIPTPVANEGYAFDKWSTTPEATTVVTGDLMFTAEFALDENNNDIPDYKEDHFNVEFTSEHAELLEGTTKFENILTGLKFYDEVEVPTIIEDNTDNLAFDKWNPVLPEENAKVESNLTFEAIFAEDLNNNEIPDKEDKKVTIEFIAGENGSLTGTTKYENLLIGLTFEQAGIVIPTPVANENYIFNGWNKEIVKTVESEETYTAEFAPDFNDNGIDDNTEEHFTIEFIAGENGSLEGTTKYENILVDLTFEQAGIIIPTPVANEGYTFDKWTETTPENTTVVTGDLTFTAEFALDENNNDIPDYKEENYTVEFTSQYKELLSGTTKFENILTGLNFYDEVEVPTIIENKEDNLAFDKWNPVLPEENAKVKSNLTFEAVFAEDKNNNEIPDYKETKYTVEFIAGENGSLEGTTKFENLLIDLTLAENSVVIPTPVANEGYAFDKWSTTLETTTVVTGNLTFTATFAIDENNNDIPDYKEDKYTVEFTSQYKELLSGTTKFENILTGLNFYDEVEVPTIIENNTDNLAFDKWNPVLPEESAKVENDLTFEAVFAEDRNNNETPDYKETKYTVTFKNDDGKVLKTEQVLPGLSATAPSNPTKENTQEFTYEFAGWDNSFTNVQSDLVVTATYNSTKNKYTVTFVDYNDTVLGTSTVEYGTSAVAPSNPTRVNYTFTGWDKEFTNVTSNITVKAQYTANIIGIRVEEKANAQLVFQVNSNIDIKNYINVYKKYADGTEELATANEYTTNFTTANVGENIKLTVTLNSYTDSSLTYDITSDVAYQTKFEVLKVSTGYGYRKTTKSNCTSNCDSEANTTFVETEYMVLEMIEHYMENITITKVKGIYQDNTEKTLVYSESIRWSKMTGWLSKTKYDPVRILSLNNQDIMTAENPLKYVDITYDRTGYGSYTIRFAYNANTSEFVAISEVKH